MADERQNEQAQQTADQAQEPAKKEGKLSGFFKKVGQKLDDAAYDARLASDFAKNHPSYQIFTGTGVFSANPEVAAEEHLDGDEKYILAFGENDVIKAGCMIRKGENGPVCHIVGVEPASLAVEFEGKTNQKPAQKIILGGEAEKVDVIKVGEEFYKV